MNLESFSWGAKITIDNNIIALMHGVLYIYTYTRGLAEEYQSNVLNSRNELWATYN